MSTKLLKVITFLLISVFLLSCGTSTGSRFPRKDTRDDTRKEQKDEKQPVTTKEFVEDFDMSPYVTTAVIEDKKPTEKREVRDVWFDYAEDQTRQETNRNITGTVSGYRVQVISTDDLEEANSIRSEIYFKANQNNVYIVFDPPFYKVKVGDFINIRDANDLSFKLIQLGFNESRVVSEQVNVYE